MDNLTEPKPEFHPCTRCHLHGIKPPVHFCEVKDCDCEMCKILHKYWQINMKCDWIFCTACNFHGIKTGFQHICQFRECNCARCNLLSPAPEDIIEKPRRPKCAACRNHGMKISTKKHRKDCPYLNCNCRKCTNTRLRLKAMKEQVRIMQLRKMGIKTEQKENFQIIFGTLFDAKGFSRRTHVDVPVISG